MEGKNEFVLLILMCVCKSNPEEKKDDKKEEKKDDKKQKKGLFGGLFKKKKKSDEFEDFAISQPFNFTRKGFEASCCVYFDLTLFLQSMLTSHQKLDWEICLQVSFEKAIPFPLF